VTNSLSSLENIDLSEFTILYPFKIGEAIRANTEKMFYVLMMQAREPVNIHYKWEPKQFLHMYLDSTEEHMSRFDMEIEFPFLEAKLITKEYNFETISEWIHTQTKGRWSIQILADRERRPSHSYLVFYFEDDTAAMFFKLFNL
jgi:hypothetical protein